MSIAARIGEHGHLQPDQADGECQQRNGKPGEWHPPLCAPACFP